MRYEKIFTIKDGQTILVRHGEEQDGAKVLRTFLQTHEETDFLTTYPEEVTKTAEDEGVFLREKVADERSVELVAEVDGKLIGNAGIAPIRDHIKLKHRAELGIAVEKAYWRLGIGQALMEACLECAARAGYLQVELEVVGDNTGAIALYKKMGFQEYGRNPWGFRKKNGEWQELVYMRRQMVGE